jgi:hypothetical protein
MELQTEEAESRTRYLEHFTLTRGLRRLLDMAAAQAILADEIATYGRIPPRLAAHKGRSSSG